MRTLKALTLLIGISAVAYCADQKTEVFGHGGLYSETGIDEALVGGGAGYMVRPKVALFGEFNYIPVSVPLFSGLYDVGGHAFQAGGGVRGYVLPHTKVVRPFVSGLGGFMRATISGSTPIWWGAPYRTSISVNGAYAGAGFGGEIGSERLGVRPEFRYFREFVQNARDGNATTAICGVYYRF